MLFTPQMSIIFVISTSNNPIINTIYQSAKRGRELDEIYLFIYLFIYTYNDILITCWGY